MATALVPLANLTLGSTASTVTFSSISGSYRDIMLVAIVSNASQFSCNMRFNSSTTGYSNVHMEGDGAFKYTSTGDSNQINLAYNINLDGTYQNTIICSVMDYAQTDKHKSTLTRNGRAAGSGSPGTSASAGRWADTSAITTLAVLAQSGSFAAGSSFALYGISA